MKLASLKSVFKNRNNSLAIRKLRFLEYTRKFYETHNRCIAGDMCQYSPTTDSPGCAIGHLVTDARLKQKWDSFTADGYPGFGSGVTNKVIYDSLPLWMQDFGTDFLNTIQGFHDADANWEGKKLTQGGIAEFKELKSQIT